MKKNFRNTSFWCCVFVILAYVVAELVIRCDALNEVSFGIAGWLLIAGIAFLLVKVVVIPIFTFSTFPQWVEPGSNPDMILEYQQLSTYAQWLLKQYQKDVPENLMPLIVQLNQASVRRNEPAYYLIELKKILPAIHQKLSEEVCDEIIKKYMKRTAIMVVISQRGWLDSCVMLVMQLRMIMDLAKALGYRPNWWVLFSCSIWIITNSILFALFDETTAIEEIGQELFHLVTEEKIAGAIGGKLFSGALQTVSSMAILYSTGKIVKKQLLEGQKKLSAKERVGYRLEGYKTAIKQIPPIIGIAK